MTKSGNFWRGTFRRYAKRWYASWMQARENEIVLRKLEKASEIEIRQMETNAIRHFAPDANARLGLTWDGQVYRNHDSGAVYGSVGAAIRDPILEKLDAMHRLMIAAGPGGSAKAAEMLPVEVIMPALPEHVPLRSLAETYTWRDLVLGVSDAGAVRANLADLVHVAVGGSSGWGKSVFLRSLAYQLAMSVDPVDLVMIDLEKTTLAPFEQCDRLLYPVIDNEQDTVAVFEELTSELDQRRELFNQYPGIDSLYMYNAQADEPINPLVLIGDEITALLSDKNVEARLRTLALRARKFGMWLILAGQDWRAASLDIAIRNQLSCCVQFKAKSGSQSRILLDKIDARDLTIKGRALMWLPGREMIEMQAPIIGHQDIIAAMAGGAPQREVPEAEHGDLEEQVIEAWEDIDKPNITKVTAALFDGQTGGTNWTRVKKIVYSTGLLS